MMRDGAIDWFLLAAACLLVVVGMCGCGDPLPPICEAPEVSGVEAPVVGGVISTDRRSTVWVYGEGSCSGSVVGPHTVLTAAHCEGLAWVSVEGFGTFPLVDELEAPGANKPGRRDLRLVYTDVELPPPYARLGAPNECNSFIVQGYGRDKVGTLQEREVFYVDRGFGVVYFTAGSCRGDSGGPLYAIASDGPYQVAVVSFGQLPCETREEAGYVDLTQDGNIQWIQENTL